MAPAQTLKTAIGRKGPHMEPILELLRDWRFAGVAVCVGAFVGDLVYRHSAVPSSARESAQTMVKAAIASQIAHRAGVEKYEAAAVLVGVHANSELVKALRRQRRRQLVLAILVSAVVVAPAFIALPPGSIPDWVFGVVAFVGGYQAWRSW